MIFLWGANAREAHPILFHHVLQAIRKAQDLRRRSAPDVERAVGRRWLGLVWGGYRARECHGREILDAGLEHRAFIDRATPGFDAYRESVEPYTLEFAERMTGVPAAIIREVAHAYARADRA